MILTGHTRIVKIDDCIPFRMTTNACRGFCTSYAIPSPSLTLSFNPNYIITSRAQCCDIIETENVCIKLFLLIYCKRIEERVLLHQQTCFLWSNDDHIEWSIILRRNGKSLNAKSV